MKLQKILLTSFVFTLGAFFIPRDPFGEERGKRLESFSFVWSLHKNLEQRKEAHFPRKKEQGGKKLFNLLAYRENKKGKEDSFLLDSMEPFKISHLNKITQAQRFSVPLFGNAYFAYNKLGKTIHYYARDGEELWSKKYPYYPLSDYYGRLTLLLSGDSSRVYLLNPNGFLMGIQRVYGAYLSDYDFASRLSAAALIFSSGESYLIQSNGELVFKYEFASAHGHEKENLFLKSCALSPQAQFLAVHFLKGKEDRLVVLEKGIEQKAKLVYETVLPRVYPHLLHMALNSHGVLVAAPDQTLFFALDGKGNWRKSLDCKQKCPIYRPVYADKDFFAFGFGKNWALVDQKGRLLFQAALSVDIEKTWRFLPAKKAGFFGIHSGSYLEYYRYGS